jgi:ATP/ADP translocase
MAQEIQETSTNKDIAKNWVSSSRFLFYVSVFAILALAFGNCTKLFNGRYKKSVVEVNSSSQYKPEYK